MDENITTQNNWKSLLFINLAGILLIPLNLLGRVTKIIKSTVKNFLAILVLFIVGILFSAFCVGGWDAKEILGIAAIYVVIALIFGVTITLVYTFISAPLLFAAIFIDMICEYPYAKLKCKLDKVYKAQNLESQNSFRVLGYHLMRLVVFILDYACLLIMPVFSILFVAEQLSVLSISPFQYITDVGALRCVMFVLVNVVFTIMFYLMVGGPIGYYNSFGAAESPFNSKKSDEFLAEIWELIQTGTEKTEKYSKVITDFERDELKSIAKIYEELIECFKRGVAKEEYIKKLNSVRDRQSELFKMLEVRLKKGLSQQDINVLQLTSEMYSEDSIRAEFEGCNDIVDLSNKHKELYEKYVRPTTFDEARECLENRISKVHSELTEELITKGKLTTTTQFKTEIPNDNVKTVDISKNISTPATTSSSVIIDTHDDTSLKMETAEGQIYQLLIQTGEMHTINPARLWALFSIEVTATGRYNEDNFYKIPLSQYNPLAKGITHYKESYLLEIPWNLLIDADIKNRIFNDVYDFYKGLSDEAKSFIRVTDEKLFERNNMNMTDNGIYDLFYDGYYYNYEQLDEKERDIIDGAAALIKFYTLYGREYFPSAKAIKIWKAYSEATGKSSDYIKQFTEKSEAGDKLFSELSFSDKLITDNDEQERKAEDKAWFNYFKSQMERLTINE